MKVKEFRDGSFLEYDTGSFDEWCVYYTNNKGMRIAPKDIEEFSKLYGFSKKYGTDRIYSDYVKIYDKTDKDVEERVLSYITQIANEYEEKDVLEIDIVFSILYMAMISEEKKEHSKLGKRIKRLGIHTLLKENKTIEESVSFMKTMKWLEIDRLCMMRGF